VTNFSAGHLTFALPTVKDSTLVLDLLNDERFGAGAIPLPAYQTVWLTRHSSNH
jgi:hypothetical protein